MVRVHVRALLTPVGGTGNYRRGVVQILAVSNHHYIKKFRSDSRCNCLFVPAVAVDVDFFLEYPDLVLNFVELL